LFGFGQGETSDESQGGSADSASLPKNLAATAIKSYLYLKQQASDSPALDYFGYVRH
jgi:hypothetical protein